MKRQLMRAYDKIAEDYGGYRRKLLAPVQRFLSSSRTALLDIGCANLDYLKDYAGKRKIVGVDISFESLKRAKKYSTLLIQADAAELPIKSGSFSQASMLATLHHLPTEPERLMALLELKRVLKPGGRAIISVWKRWQKRFFPKNLLTADVQVPFGKHSRFYHLFSEKELEKLTSVAKLNLIKSDDTKNNIVVIADAGQCT